MKKTVKAFMILAPLTMAFLLWTTQPLTVSGAPVQDARGLYASKCASCHAMDGSGNTAKGKEMKLKDLRSAEVQALSDTKMYEIIAKGAKKMQGSEKTLGKEKCQQLVTYVRQLGKK